MNKPILWYCLGYETTNVIICEPTILNNKETPNKNIIICITGHPCKFNLTVSMKHPRKKVASLSELR